MQIISNLANVLEVGLPDAFCKNTGHFVNSARPDLSFVVILSCTAKKETMSIVNPQFSLILAGSFTFRCVCVT